jgi:hypothetical protein
MVHQIVVSISIHPKESLDFQKNCCFQEIYFGRYFQQGILECHIENVMGWDNLFGQRAFGVWQK